MAGGFLSTTLERALSWARSGSLWYLHASTGCCADEVLNSVGCRYDLERFGCLPQSDPRQADLLIVSGVVNAKAAPELKATWDAMLAPKYVMAVGACACGGGLFAPGTSPTVTALVQQILPVDIFVPGCPPRPEMLMHGLLKLQEKIRGFKGTDLQT